MKSINQYGRLDNTTTCLPLAYGSIAFYLGAASDEYHTHRWTLYVRSPDPSFDLSRAISKVIFQLHPSFAQPTRELVYPPYEVTETGWGEFEASIRLVWKDEADERSTLLTHGIRLYPQRMPPTSADPTAYMNTTVPVVAERYDEVVFTNPKSDFHQNLINENSELLSYPLSNETNVARYFRTYGDEDDIKMMLAAKTYLEGELCNVKERLLRVDVELDDVKRTLLSLSNAGMVITTGTGIVGGGATIGGTTQKGKTTVKHATRRLWGHHPRSRNLSGKRKSQIEIRYA